MLRNLGLKISYIFCASKWLKLLPLETKYFWIVEKFTIDAAFRQNKKLSGQNGANSVGCYLRLDQKEHGENLDLINTFNSVWKLLVKNNPNNSRRQMRFCNLLNKENSIKGHLRSENNYKVKLGKTENFRVEM